MGGEMKPIRGKDCNFTLQWADDERPNLGDGVSRTSDPRSALWEIAVAFGAARPMKEYIRAVNNKQAIKFAKNRYPKATSITVIGKHVPPIRHT
jgi:hypothetical protein